VGSKDPGATLVSIGESIEVEPASVLPYRMLEDLSRRASHRFILNECACRTASDCMEHPVGQGCVFLGDAAADISGERGRLVDVEEALRHVARGEELGLLGCIIHSSFDAGLPGIGYRKLLAVCFCCSCCCTFRTDVKVGREAHQVRTIRLPGLVMSTVGECGLCEKCARACSLGAITVGRDGPVFADNCRGCGRCAAACPRRNIRIRLDRTTGAQLLDRIGVE
jgi:ferredoxin